MQDPHFLTELYWFTSVVELGSYSAAAEQAGVAKSSLSRRMKALEERVGVQLLSRHTRKLMMTTIGEKVYRHALDMLLAAQAAETCAEEALDQPGGLIRIAIPAILSTPLMNTLNAFKLRHANVRYDIQLEDDLDHMPARHLDLCLSLRPVPQDSAEIVARPLAALSQVIVASPALLERIGVPARVSELSERHILAYGQRFQPEPWPIRAGLHQISKPALLSTNLRTLKEAAIAGLGFACLPQLGCHQELADNSLQVICSGDGIEPMQLSALTPSFKGITLTTRHLIDAIHANLVQPGS